MPKNWNWLQYLFCRWFHPPMVDVSEKYHPTDKHVAEFECPACGKGYWWHRSIGR